jgi:hypothetical protein
LPAGSEFQVNTYTTFGQRSPRVAADADGDFVVVWHSSGQDGHAIGGGVFGQRYDSAGAKVGTEFRANTSTAFDQNWPDVAADGAGRFVVVWDSETSPEGIFGRRYDAAGAPLGAEFSISTSTLFEPAHPTVATFPSGDFVVAWQRRNATDEIVARRFNSSGVAQGAEFQVNSYTTGDQQFPALAADASGRFIVTWESAGQDGNGRGVFARRYDSMGMTLGTEFRVNTYTTADQRLPDVAAEPSGAFVVLWSSNGQDGSEEGVFGQRYTSAGAPAGVAFQVNTFTAGAQARFLGPAVAAESTGAFFAVWDSEDQDGNAEGVYGKRFRANQCGDGISDTVCGEGCDDGNTAAGDCCSPACVAASDGTSCNDGNNCTGADLCTGGACVPGACLQGTGCMCGLSCRQVGETCVCQ